MSEGVSEGRGLGVQSLFFSSTWFEAVLVYLENSTRYCVLQMCS